MNARRFDALTVAMTSGAQRASRRRVLRGLAMLAAMGVTPGVARAFDGGPLPVQPAVGGVSCNSGADCAAGEICLNGACAPRGQTGTGTTGQLVGASTTPGPTAAGAPAGTTPVAAPETVPQTGVGGLIQPGATAASPDLHWSLRRPRRGAGLPAHRRRRRRRDRSRRSSRRSAHRDTGGVQHDGRQRSASPICSPPSMRSTFGSTMPIRPPRSRAVTSAARLRRAPKATSLRSDSRSAVSPPTPVSPGSRAK